MIFTESNVVLHKPTTDVMASAASKVERIAERNGAAIDVIHNLMVKAISGDGGRLNKPKISVRYRLTFVWHYLTLSVP